MGDSEAGSWFVPFGKMIMAKQERWTFPGRRRSRGSLVQLFCAVWLLLSHFAGTGVGQRRLDELGSLCTCHTMPVWVGVTFSIW